MKHYRHFSLKNKLLVLTVSSVSIIFIIIFFIFISTINNFAEDVSLQEAKRIAEYYANNVVRENLNTAFTTLRTISHGFIDYKELPIPLRQKLVDNQLDRIIRSNPNFKCVFTDWENEAVINNGNPKVRFSSTLLQEGNLIRIIKPNTEEELATSDYYMLPKTTLQEQMQEPYMYVYEEGSEKLLITTLAVPIIKDGKFIGMSGIDILLENIDKDLSKVHPYEKGYLLLFSNAGVVVSHPDKSFIGKNITEIMPNLEEKFHIKKSIQDGTQFSFTWTDEHKDLGKITTIFIPIQIGNDEKKWSLGVVMPNDMIFAKTTKVKFISVAIFIVALLILSALIWIIATGVSKSINNITTKLSKMFNVDFIKDGMVKSNNEIDKIDIMNEYFNHLTDYEIHLISNLIPQSNLISESAIKLVEILKTNIRTCAYKSGKGFGVIANEIKELSKVFTKASEEINGLITNIESHSNKVLKIMQKIISVTSTINQMTKYISNSIDGINKYIIPTNVEQQTMFISEILQEINEVYESKHLISDENDELIKNFTNYIKVSEDLTECATYLSKLTNNLYVDLKDNNTHSFLSLSKVSKDL